MSDEKFEEFLQRGSASYNEPPARVPRDEMFAAITAMRAERRRPGVEGRTVGARVSIPRAALIGMAATLVIGVAIGRYALSERRGAGSGAAMVRDGRPAIAAGGADRPSSPVAETGHASAYARAATAELARAEALLTAYGAPARGTPASAGVDRQLSAWARDILSNTRLLLDSPAADDPVRRRLLQDLELVLVQMVQRSPEADAAGERSHIDRSIERTHVISRLRAALPAGHPNGI